VTRDRRLKPDGRRGPDALKRVIAHRVLGAAGVQGPDRMELPQERVDNLGIELGPASLADDLDGLGHLDGVLVDPRARQRVEDVGDRDDPTRQRDGGAAEPGR
jgi:hypothetical protein